MYSDRYFIQMDKNFRAEMGETDLLCFGVFLREFGKIRRKNEKNWWEERDSEIFQRAIFALFSPKKQLFSQRAWIFFIVFLEIVL